MGAVVDQSEKKGFLISLGLHFLGFGLLVGSVYLAQFRTPPEPGQTIMTLVNMPPGEPPPPGPGRGAGPGPKGGRGDVKLDMKKLPPLPDIKKPVIPDLPVDPEPEATPTKSKTQPKADDKAAPTPTATKPAKDAKESSKMSYEDFLKSQGKTTSGKAKPQTSGSQGTAPPGTKVDAKALREAFANMTGIGKTPGGGGDGPAGGGVEGGTGNGGGGQQGDPLEAAFFNGLKKAIDVAWEKPQELMGRQLVAVAEFDVLASGKIVNGRITQSSGMPAFDQSVLDALKNAAARPHPKGTPYRGLTLAFKMIEGT